MRHIPTTFHFVLCTVYIIAETTQNNKCLPHVKSRNDAAQSGSIDNDISQILLKLLGKRLYIGRCTRLFRFAPTTASRSPPPLAQGRLGYAPFSRRITQYQLPSPMRRKWRAQRADGGAHAARGFVSGAAWNVFVRAVADRTFQCRTRLCGWCSNEDKRRFF